MNTAFSPRNVQLCLGKVAMAIGLCVLWSAHAYGQDTFTSNQSGNWSNPALWDINGTPNPGVDLPSSLDSVVILHDVVLDVGTATVGSMWLDLPNSGPSSLQIPATDSLYVLGDLVMDAIGDGPTDSLIFLLDGYLKVSGNFFINENLSTGNIGPYLGITGTADVNTNFEYNLINKPSTQDMEEIVLMAGSALNIAQSFEVYTSGAPVTPVDLVATGDATMSTDKVYFAMSEGEFEMRFYDTSYLTVTGNMYHQSPGEVSGGYINFHDFSTIEFAGTATQNIFGMATNITGDSVIFNDVVITNPTIPAVYMAYGEWLIRGKLDFQGGPIEAENTGNGSAPIVIFDTAATYAGYGDGKYIEGLVGAINPTDFTLPLGSRGRIGPLRIFNVTNNSAATLFEAQYLADSSIGEYNPPTVVQRYSEKEHWTLYDRNISATPFVELNWVGDGYSGIDNTSSLLVLQTTTGGTALEARNRGSVTATSIASGNPITPESTVPAKLTYGAQLFQFNLFGSDPLRVYDANAEVAFPGDAVSISGFGFSTIDSVRVGTVPAKVTDATTTTLTFTMPNSAIYAPIRVIRNGKQRSTAQSITPQQSLDEGAVFDANTFSTSTAFGTAISNVQPSDLVAADFDRDGQLDIALSIPDSSWIEVYFQNNDSTFTLHTIENLASPASLVVGDFNNDQHLDLAYGSELGNNVSILHGDGARNFSVHQNLTASGNHFTGLHVLGYGEENPFPAIVGTNNSSQVAIFAFQDSSGQYEESILLNNGEGSIYTTVGDFNGDSLQDVVAMDGGIGELVLITQDDLGNLTKDTNVATLSNMIDGKMAVTDRDLDGVPELLLSRQPDGGSFAEYLYNTATNQFEQSTTYSLPSQALIEEIVVAQIDGKFGNDVIVFTNDTTNNYIGIFLADGAGGYFTPIEIEQTNMTAQAAWAQDVSGNGFPDLIVHAQGTFGNRIFYNNTLKGAPTVTANNVIAFALSPNEAQIHFDGTDGADGFLVRRFPSGTSPAFPIDGTAPAAGTFSGDIKTVGYFESGPVTDTGLVGNTSYDYEVVSYNNSEDASILYNLVDIPLVSVSTPIDSLLQDSLVLVALYDSLGGTGWTNSTNWSTGTLDTWYGVTVEGSRVSRLDLSSNNLNGELPDTLGDFVQLEYLNLSDNNLYGRLPTTIGNLLFLDSLILNNDSLQGQIPNEITNLFNMVYLDLSNNDFNNGPTFWSAVPLQDVKVENNQLPFGVLEAFDGIGLSTFTYDPQTFPAAEGEGMIYVDSLLTISGVVEAPGGNDEYAWTRNGDTLASQNSTSLSISNTQLADEGTYYLLVTNTLLAGTHTYGPFDISVSTYLSDSVYLTDFRNNIDTANNGWINQTNWLSGPLDTWYGVTADSLGVTALDLSDNNMIGQLNNDDYLWRLDRLERLDLRNNQLYQGVPASWENFRTLKELDLSENFLEYIDPVFSRIDSLDSLNITFNRLDFVALLESHVIDSATYDLQYDPQRPVFEGYFDKAQVGFSYFILGQTYDDSLGVTYQWYKDSIAIAGATGSTLEIADAQVSDGGAYFVEHYSTALPGLTLTEGPFTLSFYSLEADSVNLYNGFVEMGSGAGWFNSDNWGTGPLDTWYGVTVADSSVTALDLSANNIDGQIPFWFGLLSSLQTMNLSNNNLGGVVPQDFMNLSSIHTLDLNNNELTEVPALDSLPNLDTVNLSYNRFTFDDLAPLMGAFSNFNYYFQKTQGSADTLVFKEGDPAWIIGFPTHDSTADAYQWLFNGDTLAGKTDSVLQFTNISASDAGQYVLQATSTLVPDLILSTEPITVEVEPNEQDSTWLAEAYLALNGDNWTNNTNWLTGAIDTWYGVTVVDGRVIRLELPGNNVVGDFPPSLLNLTAIEHIDLSDNDLTSGVSTPIGWENLEFLDLSKNNLEFVDSVAKSAMTYLDLSENGLQFASLQRNLGVASFTYAPQQQLQDAGDSVIAIGSDLNITIFIESTGGITNFSWLKEGDTLAGQTDSSLLLTGITKSDAGLYRAQAENSQLPGLILVTGLFDLKVSTLDRDSTALLALYDSLGGESWTNNTNWQVGEIQDWYGVTVEDLSVTAVDLNNNNLAGTLPPSLATMSELRSIRLGGNKIEGRVPITWLSFPRLNNLELEQNALTQIPDFNQLDSITNLNVTENRLDFNDLSPLVNLSGALYNPQSPLTDPVDTLVNLGDSVGLVFPVPGAESIQWTKDGVDLPNQTNPVISLRNVTFAADGEYVAMATSSAVPGLTLQSDTILVAVSSLERDSLVLRQLYQTTGGQNWTDQPNWDTEPITSGQWEGIDISNNRVTGINLPARGLSGYISPRIRDLRFLETLNVSVNDLVSIPDLSGMDSLQTLNVSDNNLQFGSLEPNMGITNFSYSPQGSFGLPSDTVVEQGTAASRTLFTTGANNQYQWYRNGEAVSGANSATLTVDSVNFEDMGLYRLDVTNTVVPNLTLSSRAQRLLAYSSLGGMVNSNQGPIEEGNMYLFRVQARRYDSLGPVALQPGGLFRFDSVVLGNFVMVAIPNRMTYPDGLRTWYGDVLFWPNADTIQLRTDVDSLSINMLGIPEPTEGDFSIAGTLFEDIADSTGRIERQRRVKGATVSVSREVTFERVLTTTYELVAITETDENGEFEFRRLPGATYRIFIEYPGVPMDSTSSIDITVGANETDSAVTVTATVLEENIAVEIEEVQGFRNPAAFPIIAYPNPTSGTLTVQLGGRTTGEISVQVQDLNGRVIDTLITRAGANRTLKLSLAELPPGVYLIRVEDLDTGRLRSVSIRKR